MATKNLLLLVSGLAVLFLGVPAQVSAPPIDSRRVRSAADHENGGPQCKFERTSTIEEQCSFVCEEVWNEEATRLFLPCSSPMRCFTEFWESSRLGDKPQVEVSIYTKLQNDCSFGTRPSFAPIEQYDGYQEYALDELLSSSIFGGEALCKDKELRVVDFLTGHPTAYVGDNNCMLYSQGVEVAAACERDKETNNRLFCELEFQDLPEEPALSDLCSSPPSDDYLYSFFYVCVPPSPLPACEAKRTTSWNYSENSCECPSGSVPCTVQEAKAKESWKDGLRSKAQVYMKDSIRYIAYGDIYQAFDLSSNPCEYKFVRALCRNTAQTTTTTTTTTAPEEFLGNMGPNCYKGNDQPFCRLPCVTLWRLFYSRFSALNSYDQFESFWKSYDFTKLPSLDASAIARAQACTFEKRWEYEEKSQFEFSKILKNNDGAELEIEHNCTEYERWTLVKVVGGHEETLNYGRKFSSCPITDITQSVKSLLPNSIFNGQTNSEKISLAGITNALHNCPEDKVAYYMAWNCAPNLSISSDSISIICNIYRTTGEKDAQGDACACPNSAKPCSANAAAVSQGWIQSAPKGTTISLSGFLVYKTQDSGTGSLVILDDLNPVCEKSPTTHVLCQDAVEDPLTNKLPVRRPLCQRAFSTIGGATEADDWTCREACIRKIAGDCSSVMNPWLCVANAIQDCYIPNSNAVACYIQSPGPEDPHTGSCTCTGSALGPCTPAEAQATAYAWKSTLSQYWGGEGGVIVAKHNRALWMSTPPSWHYEAGPQNGKCGDNTWIKGVFCLGSDARMTSQRSGVLAPDCSTASSKDSTKASTFQCTYVCGHIEWQCRTHMADNPTLYKDLMHCYRKLRLGTILEHCDVQTTPQTPTAGAANMAVSWMLASGNESTVQFSKPIYPEPIIFTGAPHSVAGIPRLLISQVTNESFRVQAFGASCREPASQASAELKVVASYLAIPPGQYRAKHSPIRLVVGTTDVTATGEFLLRTPFLINDFAKAVVLLEVQSAVGQSPSTIAASAAFRIVEKKNNALKIRLACLEPFTSITVGYLIANLSDESSSTTSPLTASLGGRSLAIFSTREVDREDVRFPQNLPTFFFPHIFPQIAGEGPGKDEFYSVQWHSREDGLGWVPSVWVSTCSLAEDVLRRLSNSEVHFTALYFAAVAQMNKSSFSSRICNVTAVSGSSRTDEECSQLCSGIYFLYCWSSTSPLQCLNYLLPQDFRNECNSPSDKNSSGADSANTDSGEGTTAGSSSGKCRVFDMRNYPANLAWDSASFTCRCPGLAMPCTTEDAAHDMTWLKELQGEGGLCETSQEPIKPVTQMFRQLSINACSITVIHSSFLHWRQRAFPAYPDLPGAGTGEQAYSGTYLCQHVTPYVLCPSNAADAEGVEEQSLEVVHHVPPSCFPGEWGEWSACSATCLGSHNFPRRYRKRSAIAAEVIDKDPDCILEETEGCGDSLQLCVGYCWTAEWTEWSGCASYLRNDEVVIAKRRYKPIFAGAVYCREDETQEFQLCRKGPQWKVPGAQKEEEKEAEEESAPNAEFAELLSFASNTTAATIVSNWSGCDVPCILPEGHTALQRRLARNTDTGAFLAITSGTSPTRSCSSADGLENCRSFDLDCSEVVSIYEDSASRRACIDRCRTTEEKCRNLASLDALLVPFRGCVTKGLSDNGFYLTCRLKEDQRISPPATCRPILTRLVNQDAVLSFLKETSNEETPTQSPAEASNEETPTQSPAEGGFVAPSCACLEHSMVPCTADDIVEDWRGIRGILLASDGLCSTEAARTPLWAHDESSKLPDSSVYFAYAGMGRIHCPLRGYKKDSTGIEEYFTFTEFPSTSALNDYCKNGLDSWKDANSSLMSVPDCSRAIANAPSGMSPSEEETAKCKELCTDLKNTCNADKRGDSYRECFIEPFQSGEFAEKCTFAPSTAGGRGVIFCKEKEAHLLLTEWSEWSSCSLSCFSSVSEIGSSVRIRTREVMEEGHKVPRGGEFTPYTTVETGICADIPLCDPTTGGTSPEYVMFTTKAPPKIEIFTSETSSTTPLPTYPDKIPLDMTPQQCVILSVEASSEASAYDESIDSCSCPVGYRPCYQNEAAMSRQNWVDSVYVLCAAKSGLIIGMRHFHEFSCVHRGFISTTTINTLSSIEEKEAYCASEKYMFCAAEGDDTDAEHGMLFIIGSLCLGALAGVAVAYLSLQYSIDLQKLMGLRGRYATISLELQQLKEQKAREERTPLVTQQSAGAPTSPSEGRLAGSEASREASQEILQEASQGALQEASQDVDREAPVEGW